MNFFQEQLKAVFDLCDNIDYVQYIGRAAYIALDNGLKIKTEFVSLKVADEYDALRLSTMNNESLVDKVTLRFSDYFAPKRISEDIKTTPRILTDDQNPKWYCKPSHSEMIGVASAIEDYAYLFTYDPVQNSDLSMNM